MYVFEVTLAIKHNATNYKYKEGNADINKKTRGMVAKEHSF